MSKQSEPMNNKSAQQVFTKILMSSPGRLHSNFHLIEQLFLALYEEMIVKKIEGGDLTDLHKS